MMVIKIHRREDHSVRRRWSILITQPWNPTYLYTHQWHESLPQNFSVNSIYIESLSYVTTRTSLLPVLLYLYSVNKLDRSEFWSQVVPLLVIIGWPNIGWVRLHEGRLKPQRSYFGTSHSIDITTTFPGPRFKLFLVSVVVIGLLSQSNLPPWSHK